MQLAAAGMNAMMIHLKACPWNELRARLAREAIFRLGIVLKGIIGTEWKFRTGLRLDFVVPLCAGHYFNFNLSYVSVYATTELVFSSSAKF